MQERVAELERRNDRLNKDIDRLCGYIEVLITGVRMVEGSWTWKVGRSIVHNTKRLLSRPDDVTFFRESDELYEGFCHWKRSRD